MWFFKRNKRQTAFHAVNPASLPWMILVLCLVIIPHILRLPVWLTGFIAIVVFIRLATLLKTGINVPKWLTFIMTISAIGGIMLEYARLFGRDAGVSLLTVMLFLKLLETRTHRDGMLLICMTYFLVITNFLFTQSIPTAIYMLVCVLFITFTLVKLNEPVGNMNDRLENRPLHMAAQQLILALPFMIVLFFLFPRIPGPLWGLPADANAGKTGLSDKMTFGNIGKLALSDAVAFRVKFDQDIPANDSLYWRAIVMENFDGETWTQNPRSLRTHAREYQVDGKVFDYTVTLEPHGKSWLVVLEMPANIDGIQKAMFNLNYQLISVDPINELKQYRISSHTRFSLDKHLSKQQYDINTQLPDNMNPKARRLVTQWQQQYDKPQDIVNNALNYFRQNNFIYSLQPPLLSGNLVDNFLFSTRKGFCEHYAGSFVFLMRAAGIPARIVAGYQGGELNTLSDYMLIRQADAHAWAEVWLQDRGWVRVDPTAFVSPNRIEANIDAALSRNENPRFLIGRDNALWRQTRLLWDAMNNNWNQWVIGYDQTSQTSLLEKLGVKDNISHTLIYLLIASSLIFSTIFYIVIFRQSLFTRQARHKRLYRYFCTTMKKLGLPRKPYEGAIEYTDRIAVAIPDQAILIQAIGTCYANIEYANRSNTLAIKQLWKLIRIFKSATANRAKVC